MNALVQQESLLVGSEEAVKELERKQSARILVMSDTHGEYELVESVICEFGADCDALVFCGDGIGDLMACIEGAPSNEKLNDSIPPVVAFARGNCDADSYFVEKEEGDNVASVAVQSGERQMLKVASRNVFVVHGHRHGVDMGLETLAAAASALDADMVFFGHTHRPLREETEGTLMLNPGSVSRPRGGAEPTFAVVSFPGENERYTVEFFTVTAPLFGDYIFTPADL